MEVYTTYSDLDLIQLLANNDHEAFEQLYERHWFYLYQSAFYLLRNSSASKDVVQDVFLWVWENRSSLQISNVKAYLKAAVRFKVANFIRSGNIRESFFDKLSGASLHGQAPSGDEFAEVRELQQIIHDAILQLPERCQEIYRLSKEEGMSNREIAERLDVSIKTVEAQMTIALKRLRTRVGFRLVCLLIVYSFLS